MSRLPDRVDAVFISHGHPDHCADLRAHPGRGPGLVVTPR
jgi:ribonuclease BN (tRNA processing enzyme)